MSLRTSADSVFPTDSALKPNLCIAPAKGPLTAPRRLGEQRPGVGQEPLDPTFSLKLRGPSPPTGEREGGDCVSLPGEGDPTSSGAETLQGEEGVRRRLQQVGCPCPPKSRPSLAVSRELLSLPRPYTAAPGPRPPQLCQERMRVTASQGTAPGTRHGALLVLLFPSTPPSADTQELCGGSQRIGAWTPGLGNPGSALQVAICLPFYSP